nr:MAG TPA: hypothetical protein [Caudoviricetes sp.]
MQPLSGGAGLFFYPVLQVGVAHPAKSDVFARMDTGFSGVYTSKRDGKQRELCKT